MRSIARACSAFLLAVALLLPATVAHALPPGMTETWDGYTSGTNGVPIHVRKTNRDGMWWNAFFLRDLEWGRLDPRAPKEG